MAMGRWHDRVWLLGSKKNRGDSASMPPRSDSYFTRHVSLRIVPHFQHEASPRGAPPDQGNTNNNYLAEYACMSNTWRIWYAGKSILRYTRTHLDL
eukprot:1970110-Amphidinium_carterae.2